MASDASPIESTVRRLESVTAEIGELRDAVATHRNAALGLDSVARVLGDLSLELARLPTDVRSEFSGAADLMSKVGAAIQPAGTLEQMIRESIRENGENIAAIRRDREAVDQTVRGFRDDVIALRGLVVEQHKQSVEDAKQLLEKAHLANERIGALEKRLDVAVATHARDTETIKGRLAKLTGLARRGFFALLRGKDAPADPN